MKTIFHLSSFPTQAGEKYIWRDLYGTSASLILAESAAQINRPLLIIASDSLNEANLLEELTFFKIETLNILSFPGWETLPYDQFSPHQDIISERLAALARIPHLQQGIIVTSIPTLMHVLPAQDYLNAYSFALKIGDTLDIEHFSKRLNSAGYQHVTQVREHGEFAVRGSIIDLFPMGSNFPLRLDLLDEEIDSIRSFSPETQRTIEKQSAVSLLPAKEFPLTDEAVDFFRQAWRTRFPGQPLKCPVYQDISEKICANGIEYYLPLFFDRVANLFDFLPKNMLIATIGNLEEKAKEFWQEIMDRYEQGRFDVSRPLCSPQEMFLNPEKINNFLNNFPQINIFRESSDKSAWQNSTENPSQIENNPHLESCHSALVAESWNYLNRIPQQVRDDTQQVRDDTQQVRDDTQQVRDDTQQVRDDTQQVRNDMQQVRDDTQQVRNDKNKKGDDNKNDKIWFTTSPAPRLNVNYKANHPLALLENYISQHPGRILFCAESLGRKEALLQLFCGIKLFPHFFPSWQAYLESAEQYGLVIAPLEEGFHLSEHELTVLPESHLYGKRVTQRQVRKKSTVDADALIRDLTELKIGDAVVHIQHGIGRYLGLQILHIGDQTNEFLTLEYQNEDKLYVPVTHLHLINRYCGVHPDQAPINKLGTEQWQRTKRKAEEKIYDIAAELLHTQATRAKRLDPPYKVDQESYAAFAQGFPFEETPDQTQAIEQIINDLQKETLMDRLVCGDVGFGKTEVAMRAAFIAVQNNKQVVILVPTTLLAQQHLKNFQNRFADWPIQIEMLSRFRTPKEQKIILQKCVEGKIDILIGTHKLLQNTMQFKSLGLIIIDEEHRFGVKQKEKLKSLRALADLLTLTATPIPRTLNMALAGIRGLSIMATAPSRRLSVKTFVHEYKKSIIQEALQREILRGGQVYFLHNDIATIALKAQEISQYGKEIRLAVAHGQMHERDLEKIMFDFYHRHYNVLLCSTIIESGIDIPTANTIIINRADQFGLAQLHQLRGRVGRSHHQAYAYLLIPNKELLSKDATKRLEAIAALDELGAGFTLATHDLEIRGAGELLGEEQSGHIHEIGFTLYMDLLARATESLKEGKTLDLAQPKEQITEIDLHLPALIPDTYLSDVEIRLQFYKRIANAINQAHLDELQIEMIDRFGLLPTQLKTLFKVTELKLKAENLGIIKIDANSKVARLDFSEKPNVKPQTIIKLIQNEPTKFRLEGSKRLRITLEEHETTERVRLIETLLERLT